MPVGCSSCVDLLRGGLSWPGVVVLWTVRQRGRHLCARLDSVEQSAEKLVVSIVAYAAFPPPRVLVVESWLNGLCCVLGGGLMYSSRRVN